MSNLSVPPSPSAAAIAVVGAAGHTGRFVIAELLRRGFAPIAIVRSTAQSTLPAGVDARFAAVQDTSALAKALTGARVVINCAGPFLDTAELVARAAIAQGAHYLDVSAEQQSVREIYERSDHWQLPRDVVLMPGMGFFGGFSDLLVTLALGDWQAADEVSVMIALSSWHPTDGTRRTGQRNTFPRVVVENGRLEKQIQPPTETAWTFPEPFGQQEMLEVPLSEMLLMSRHLKVPRVRNYLNRLALEDLRDASSPTPLSGDDRGRSGQRFVVQAIVRRGDVRRIVQGSGQDIYAFTAPLVCEAAIRLMTGPLHHHGAQAPGAVFPAGAFLDALVSTDQVFNYRIGPSGM